jgi:dCMP deaminase
MELNKYIGDIKNITNDWTERIDWDSYFMSIAFLISSRSSCSRLHVGCVLVKDTRIISVGYNGFLPKIPHISKVRDGHEQATVHAEQNAISDCSKRGIVSKDTEAYVTHYPCINCCKILIASGIKNIKYNLDYNNDPFVKDLLQLSNIPIQKI